MVEVGPFGLTLHTLAMIVIIGMLAYLVYKQVKSPGPVDIPGLTGPSGLARETQWSNKRLANFNSQWRPKKLPKTAAPVRPWKLPRQDVRKAEAFFRPYVP